MRQASWARSQHILFWWWMVVAGDILLHLLCIHHLVVAADVVAWMVAVRLLLIVLFQRCCWCHWGCAVFASMLCISRRFSRGVHNLLILRVELRSLLTKRTHRHALGGDHASASITIAIADATHISWIQLANIYARLWASYIWTNGTGVRIGLPLLFRDFWLNLNWVAWLDGLSARGSHATVIRISIINLARVYGEVIDRHVESDQGALAAIVLLGSALCVLNSHSQILLRSISHDLPPELSTTIAILY